jgi:hypothetical protein
MKAAEELAKAKAKSETVKQPEQAENENVQ